MKTYVSLALCVFLCSCTVSRPPTTYETATSSAYGPRWVDYDEWGNLQLGTPKSDVLKIMGEPYLPKDAVIQSGNGVERLIFKIRAKYYPVGAVTRSDQKSAWGTVIGSEQTSQSRKPTKSAQTGVWGDEYDLICVFQNGKLDGWFVPELQKPQKASETTK